MNDGAIVTLYRSGLSLREVAGQLGVSPMHVAGVLRRLKEPRRSGIEGLALRFAKQTGVRELTHEVARRLFNYDPDTGRMEWAEDRIGRGIKAGDMAGYVQHGRIHLRIGGRKFQAARVIWFYTTGEWPKRVIDHINGDAMDNRWCNLRDVTIRMNTENIRKPTKNNKSGFLGVSLVKGARPYIASIGVDGKRIHLGSFCDPQEAHQAYLKAKRIYHKGNTQ